MQIMVAGALLALLFITPGCVVVPNVAPRKPIYTPPTESLQTKAATWEQATMSRLNRQGLLLYKAWDPATWNQGEKGTADYWESHDIADAPAWHGRLMVALAMAWAMDGRSRDGDLLKLTNGLLQFYTVSGQSGLLGRSYMVGYEGERLPWMHDVGDRPTKFWKKTVAGWWRTGAAKNHLLGAVLGCAIPLHLHETGRIQLTTTTRQRMIDLMVPAVSRLAQGNYRIIGFDGKPTEFGDLRPAVVPQEYINLVKPFVGFFGIDPEQLDNLSRPINGYNMTLVLAMLRGAAPYDPYLKQLYETEAAAWGSGIALSLRILGQVIKRIGHAKLGKPSYSDMEAFAFAAMALLMMEPSSDISKDVKKGMKGLWGFMQFERNAMFTLPYAGLVDGTVSLTDVTQDLQDFPGPEQKLAISYQKVETDIVQPLANRPPKSHYWKSSPFVAAGSPGNAVLHPVRGSRMMYPGQDYLVAYWTGRFFGVLRE